MQNRIQIGGFGTARVNVSILSVQYKLLVSSVTDHSKQDNFLFLHVTVQRRELCTL